MATRYAYTLFELHKKDRLTTHYKLLEQHEINHTEASAKALASGLMPWALEVLLPCTLDAGLYSAEFVTLDDNDEPDRYLYTVSICQNGPDQVSTWPDPYNLAAV